MSVEDIATLALIGSFLALFISVVVALLFKRWQNIYKAATPDNERLLDPKLIEEMKRRYASLPEHSVKWRAYRKRLIEAGELDGD